jgi:hypothetical protein
LPLVPHSLNLDRDCTAELAAERRNAGLVAEVDAAVGRRTTRRCWAPTTTT